MPGSFFDTDVLLYLAGSESVKADRAEQLVARGGIISVQVLNEFVNVCRRKRALAWSEIRDFLDLIRRLLVVAPIAVDVHETGLAVAERYGLPTYDAMIVASALIAGCDTLWSEDMQDGLMIDGRLWLRNPFRVSI